MSDQAHPKKGIMLNMDGREYVLINIKLNGKWHRTSAKRICELLQREEQPQPLTNEQLREMSGKTAYVIPRPIFNTDNGNEYADPLMRLSRWGIVRASWITCLPWEYADMTQFAYHFEDNGILFDAYATEPKGEPND